MASDLKIYDWRESCVPKSQTFRAGGKDGGGRMTLGGYSASNPEPGGRAELSMTFHPFPTEKANLDASWTISRLMNGAVFRVPLYKTIQLVTPRESALIADGILWENEQTWENGQPWTLDPQLNVLSSAQRGEIYCRIGTSRRGEILRIGHVIGFNIDGYDFAHVIMDVSYEDGDATLEISPPLRRDLSALDQMTLQPKMLVTCPNAAEVMGQYEYGERMTFGNARFVEALV